MNEEPRNSADTGVSVVLPVFFRDGRTEQVPDLRRAIESVVEQKDAGPVEIVLVDDGSATPVASHQDALGARLTRNVRWIRLDRNGGLSNALNVGLREARYPLIGRIDADDTWGDGKLRKQLDRFAADPDLSITATGMTRARRDGEIVDRHLRPGDWRGILNFFVEVGCPFPHGSVVAKKEIFMLLGGYPQSAAVAHCEDFALWGVWLRFFKPAMIEELLYNYTVSPSSVSNENFQQQEKATWLVRTRFEALNLTDRLPKALTEFAAILGVSLTEAGIVCYRMWHHGLPVWLPKAALGPLQIILDDRSVRLAPYLGSQALRPEDVLFDRQVAVPPQTDEAVIHAIAIV